MAALALQGPALQAGARQIPSAFISDFIAAFTGSHRFVLDYLVEEVLQQPSPKTCQHLLAAYLYPRPAVSGPLCDDIRLGDAVSKLPDQTGTLAEGC